MDMSCIILVCTAWSLMPAFKSHVQYSPSSLYVQGQYKSTFASITRQPPFCVQSYFRSLSRYVRTHAAPPDLYLQPQTLVISVLIFYWSINFSHTLFFPVCLVMCVYLSFDSFRCPPIKTSSPSPAAANVSLLLPQRPPLPLPLPHPLLIPLPSLSPPLPCPASIQCEEHEGAREGPRTLRLESLTVHGDLAPWEI